MVNALWAAGYKDGNTMMRVEDSLRLRRRGLQWDAEIADHNATNPALHGVDPLTWARIKEAALP